MMPTKKVPVNNPFFTAAKVIFSRIDAFVFPRLCILCDAPRLPDNPWLCPDCLTAISNAITTRECCPRCSQNLQIRHCSCNLAWDYPFDAICSFTDYTSDIQALMHFVKYQGMKKLAAWLGELCAQSPRYLQVFHEADCLVPIPLHKSRLRKRGYNQALWLAKGIRTVHPSLDLFSEIMVRTRATGTQTELDKSERGANVAGAFSLAPCAADAVRGKKVLLIDDVITTGVTTSVAADVLLAGGCSSVTALSFARD